MSLHRLVYCSRASALGKDDIADILASAQTNNARHQITGMLMFDSGYFMQLLEGGRVRVTELFLRIAGDSRHKEVELITAGPIECRLFADWSMHYAASRGETARLLRRYNEFGAFDPTAMTSNAVERMLVEHSALSTSTVLGDAVVMGGGMPFNQLSA